MKHTLAWVVAAALIGPAWAPQATTTYDVSPTRGDHQFMFSFRQSAQVAFAPPQDNTLSTWQTLPFPWKFFGQDVTGYFISDNGFITFDNAAKASPAANTSLPNATAPKNSIFALWTDLRMEDGHGPWVGTVYTATMGTAPNRLHVIYWMSLIPAGGAFQTSAFNVALALSENGEIEVIYTSGRKGTPIKATVGLSNADGQTAVLAAGPAMDFPPVGYGGDDDQGFRFKPVVK
jgi:hypothetical protein